MHGFKIQLCSVSVALCSLLSARNADGPRVDTDKGAVEGTLTADQKVRVFKGIPFAAPPVGKLRWQAPQPAAKWTGIRPAKEFGSHCFQAHSDFLFRDAGPSEDCLTLNVWAPVDAKPGSLPVMVWIHGGAFVIGGTSDARQDGQFLAHRDVVVVSMNYRLGIFGFFVNPELTVESQHNASGNYGLMDQAAGLEWVKRNISAFGGDPGNVTIFGESAGSFCVSALMASPLAKDLFAKAIGESGAAFFINDQGFESREARERGDSRFVETALHLSTLADLRKVPANQLLVAANANTNPPPPYFGPDIDGYFLPRNIASIYAAGKQAHVPLLAGWNSDEAREQVTFGRTKPTAANFTEYAKRVFGKHLKQFLAVYPSGTDAEAETSAGDLAGDQFLVYATWRWLESQVKTGKAPVYRYYFNQPSPGDRNHPTVLSAFHSADIDYVFGTFDLSPDIAWRPEDRKLSEQMMTYWTDFARTGDPKWPPYNAASDWTVMYLNANPVAKPDPLRARYLFLDQVWGKAKN